MQSRPGQVGQQSSKEPLVFERREFERRSFRSEVMVVWFHRSSSLPAVKLKTLDLSRSGIGFLSRRCANIGDKGLMLLASGNGEPILRMFHVARCTYEGNMYYRIGARWVRVPDHLPVEVQQTTDGPILHVD